MLRKALAIILAALAPSVQCAQQAAAPDKKTGAAKIISNYSTDLSMPDTPGLSIVGLSSENIIRPSTPKTLGLAILQGRNDDGTPKQGFALDFAPTKVLYPSMSKDTYEGNYVLRALWNSQVSTGVAQPLNNNDKSTRIGIGVSSVLWRYAGTDPYIDRPGGHQKCLSEAMTPSLPAVMPEIVPDETPASPAATAPAGQQETPEQVLEKKVAALEERNKRLEQGQTKLAQDQTKLSQDQKKPGPTEALKACRKKLSEENWNETALLVGYAVSKISGRDPAVVPDAHPKGLWFSFNFGFDGFPAGIRKSLQLTASYRRLREEIVADPTDKTKFSARDGNLYGVKLYGHWNAANLFVEASRQRATIAGRDTEKTKLFVVGAERQVYENVWLTVAFGKKRGGTDASPTYLSTGLKFGFDSSSSIKP